ncbi:MAG TPA: hypothetical protein VGQ83_26250 [Polyangia bacterium]|jgi:hypothetical protein
MTPSRIALCFAVMSLAACEKVHSSAIRTAGMYADLSVTAHGDGHADVGATLRVGGALSNTYVELTSGDELAAVSGGERHVLGKRADIFNIVVYGATFAGDDEDQAFTLAFDRADDTSAPSSTATLPAPFTITAPAAGATFTPASPIQVTWSPAGKDDELSLAADACSTHFAESVADTGTYTIPAGALTPAGAPQSCAVTITLHRRRAGHVDPAFGEGGSFVATQEREVQVQVAP